MTINTSNCLFFPVHCHNKVTIIQLLIKIIPTLLFRSQCSEFSWTIHFVGVELVWASELVFIWLSLNAFEEGVSCLEAEFSIPVGELLLAHTNEPDVAKRVHFFNL